MSVQPTFKGRGRGRGSYLQNGESSGLNQNQQGGRGRGKRGYFKQQGNPVFKNGGKSIPDSYLKKSGRGPMPYNSNNQPGTYVPTVYNNMKNFKNDR